MNAFLQTVKLAHSLQGVRLAAPSDPPAELERATREKEEALYERGRLDGEKSLSEQLLRQRQENTPPAILDRVDQVVGDERLSTSRPTKTNRDDYTIAAADFGGVLARLRSLSQETQQLEQEMEKAGAPWTPGRIPEWSQQ